MQNHNFRVLFSTVVEVNSDGLFGQCSPVVMMTVSWAQGENSLLLGSYCSKSRRFDITVKSKDYAPNKVTSGDYRWA